MSDCNTSVSELVKGTTRCVQCGLCLPHCPTYGQYQDENESPRGRLLLMRLLATATSDQPRAREHLSRCLHCSACEKACPAAVEYRQLLDQTLYLQEQKKPVMTNTLAWKVGARLLTRPLWLRRAGRLLYYYQASGMRLFSRRIGLLKTLKFDRLEQDLPDIPRPDDWEYCYPAMVECRGQVLLFLGCVAQVFDRRSLQDAIFLLRQSGYEVIVPGDQNCCGALHFHHGDRNAGQHLAEQNIMAFAERELVPILTTASGCAAMLLDYGQQMATTAAQSFSSRITDLCDFLLRDDRFADESFITTPLKVAVHDPCTLRNVTGHVSAPYTILGRLPGIELVALDHNDVCCGAAGIAHLTHPQLSEDLRQPKLEAIGRIQPDVVVTSNIGCALHLGAGLRKMAQAVPVLHPISLFRQRLKP